MFGKIIELDNKGFGNVLFVTWKWMHVMEENNSKYFKNVVLTINCLEDNDPSAF